MNIVSVEEAVRLRQVRPEAGFWILDLNPPKAVSVNFTLHCNRFQAEKAKAGFSPAIETGAGLAMASSQTEK